MKPKDIFGLAVRLLGLYFLYLGLYALAQMLGSDIINSPEKMDIVYALLPVAFDLIVGWWLLGGGLLVRRAYPETSRPSENFTASPNRTAPAPPPVSAPEPAGMDQAEKKLAALVEKPKEK
ncbi:MAG TPA: hypothetical protein VMH87_06315 [Pseudomonadales bacterium]|nr:hypothetical protein [Pseudomonadales bacterium]